MQGTYDEWRCVSLYFQQRRLSGEGSKEKEEYWARGVGYGHGNRPGWDVDAYLAANREKDHKVSLKLICLLQV